MEYLGIVLMIVVFGIFCVILGYYVATKKLDKTVVKGDLVIDELDNLPYLNMRGELSELHNNDYILLKVVRFSNKPSQKKQSV